VNAILQTFHTVHRVQHEHPIFLSVSGRFYFIKRPQTVQSSRKHPLSHETFRSVHIQTPRSGERLKEMFETQHSNALGRKVENAHVHASKTKELLFQNE